MYELLGSCRYDIFPTRCYKDEDMKSNRPPKDHHLRVLHMVDLVCNHYVLARKNIVSNSVNRPVGEDC